MAINSENPAGPTGEGSPQGLDEWVRLPVFLNGTRDYVQGTQIVSRIVDAFDLGGSRLTGCAFRRITDRDVSARVLGAGEKPCRGALGTCGFSGDDGGCTVQFRAETSAARKDSVEPAFAFRRTDYSGPADMRARFGVEGLRTGEDFLVLLIQSVKGLHGLFADEVRDIWFTGLRRAEIPVGPVFPVSDGFLDLQLERLMGRQGQWQTLFRADFHSGDDRTVAAAIVNFAFKSEGQMHVD